MARLPLFLSSRQLVNRFTAVSVCLSIEPSGRTLEAGLKQEVNLTMRSRLGPGEGKVGKNKVLENMKDENTVSKQKCSYCGSTSIEADENMVRCLDCGMGNYKKGKHKGAR